MNAIENPCICPGNPHRSMLGILLQSIADRMHFRILKTESQNVALLGPTILDWVVSVFGLSRAGYTILTLSPRLSYQAMVKLMQETECSTLIYIPSAQLPPVVDQVKAAMSLKTMPTIARSEYDRADDCYPIFVRDVYVMEEKKRTAAIVHSSASTGLPKPIYISHTRCTIPYTISPRDRDFVTLPLSIHSPLFALYYHPRAVIYGGIQIPQLCFPSIAGTHVSAQDGLLPQSKHTGDVRRSHERNSRSQARHALRGSLCVEAAA